MCQSVGGDGVIVAAVGGLNLELFLGASTQGLLAHEPGNTVAALFFTAAQEALPDARTAMGVAALSVDFFDVDGPLCLFQGTVTWVLVALKPVIATTGRNLQGLAQGTNSILNIHNLDSLITLLWGSERMPKVFLKCPVAGVTFDFPAPAARPGLGAGKDRATGQEGLLAPEALEPPNYFSS